MNKPTAVVTGAGGEMGHLLLPALKERGFDVVGVDLVPLPPALRAVCLETAQASVLDHETMRSLVQRHHPATVFHLAAVLSTKAELEPDLAYDVNVGGTVGLLRACRQDARDTGRSVRFLFPSSIAVYGLPDRRTKESSGAVIEADWNRPSGIYGVAKLQCELLGAYFAQRALRKGEPGIDFRAIRFPGLISSETIPSGGTSDYAPEMLHAAAQNKPYDCFVERETRLPFMTMPDAVESFLGLAAAPASSLSTRVYNVKSFSATAEAIREAVLEQFPEARIGFEPVSARQAIVDTWPADVDDSLARREWGHAPRHGLREALQDWMRAAR